MLGRGSGEGAGRGGAGLGYWVVLGSIGKADGREVLEGWGRTQGGAKLYTTEGCACCSVLSDSATPRTAARQVPLSMKILQVLE